MKWFLLISLLNFRVHSTNRFETHYLTKLIENKETSTKHNLLTQYVAMAWGYKDFQNYTTESYLEEMADYLLEDYNLTLQEKVKSIKVRHILTTFEKIIASHMRTEKLLVTDNYKTHTRNRLKKNKFTLMEGELAMDLLIQSFAPPNLTPIEFIAQEEGTSDELEDIIITRKRSAGILLLVNSLLDSRYRLQIPLDIALDTAPKELKRLFQNQAYKNFEVYNSASLIESPDYNNINLESYQ